MTERRTRHPNQVEVALLDRSGTIVAVNEHWTSFCLANGGVPARCGVGTSYLDVCTAAAGDRDADAVAELLRAALAGRLLAPEQVQIRCDSLSRVRRFDVFVASRLDDAGRCLGATVTLCESAEIITAVEPDEAASVRALSGVAGVVADELTLNQLLGRVTEAARVLTGAGHVTVHVRNAHADAPGCVECDERPWDPGDESTVVLDALIRSRGVPFGRLHAGAAPGRTFGAAERRHFARLAAVAGTAVTNTRLYQRTERQRRWSVDAAELMQALLQAETLDPVRAVLERTRRDLDLDLASLDLVVDDATLVVDTAVGGSASDLTGRRFPRAGDPADVVLRSGRPVLTDDGGPHQVAGLDLGPHVHLPLVADNQGLGVLTVARSRSGEPFTEEDVDHLAGYARFVGLALDLARARRDHETLRSVQIRDRIAAELRDQVVRRAFSVGMRLQGVVELIADPTARERVRECVDDLDLMVREIRDTVYRLDDGDAAG
ncbi:MAG TPA: GAF domain-containing protein [Jatrophihabitans sp.]|uniref:GAF domain-containing protein n=1 Tax=Jatrophihabitans sp. TaxID=1932789 RepID=UPI002DFA3A9B|nr:GAF domain-containing protein [Jatrophihabitans sp.]